jgi:hypothetical protein
VLEVKEKASILKSLTFKMMMMKQKEKRTNQIMEINQEASI